MVRVVVIVPVHKVWTTACLIEARHHPFTVWVVFLVQVGIVEAVVTLPTYGPPVCDVSCHPFMDERALAAVIRSITQQVRILWIVIPGLDLRDARDPLPDDGEAAAVERASCRGKEKRARGCLDRMLH
jgi:hypothetical protein